MKRTIDTRHKPHTLPASRIKKSVNEKNDLISHFVLSRAVGVCGRWLGAERRGVHALLGPDRPDEPGIELAECKFRGVRTSQGCLADRPLRTFQRDGRHSGTREPLKQTGSSFRIIVLHVSHFTRKLRINEADLTKYGHLSLHHNFCGTHGTRENVDRD